MSEWVNEWMCEWVNGWLCEWVDEWMSSGLLDGCDVVWTPQYRRFSIGVGHAATYVAFPVVITMQLGQASYCNFIRWIAGPGNS